MVLPSDQQFQGTDLKGGIINVHTDVHCGLTGITKATGNKFIANKKLLYRHYKARP